jgi:DNA-directed RNA polymerase specialized sigma24 family protein
MGAECQARGQQLDRSGADVIDGARVMRIARKATEHMRCRSFLYRLDREDATQAAALALLESPDLPTDDAEGLWFVIACRGIVDHARTHLGRGSLARRVKLAMSAADALDPDHWITHHGNVEWCPEQILIAKQSLAGMLAASPRVAEAVIASSEADTSREVAAAMGVSEQAVCHLLRRAREAA